MVIRALKMLAAAVGLTLLAVLVLVALVLLYPPSDLLRRAALGVAQDALRHRSLHIGAMSLDLFGRIELRDIWLGPPAGGYELPLATIKRVLLEYDLSNATSGKIVVKRVLIERPQLYAEQHRGVLSWQAFLARLPKSKAPKKKPKKDSGPAPKLEIALEKLHVGDIGVYATRPGERVALDGLSLSLGARYTSPGGRAKPQVTAKLAIKLAPRAKGWSNIALDVEPAKAKPPMKVALDTRLSLKVRVDAKAGFDVPKAALAVDLGVTSKRFVVPARVLGEKPQKGAKRAGLLPAPPPLSLALRAKADLGARRGVVEKLALELGKHVLLALSASADGVPPQKGKPAPRVALALKTLDVPLGRLARYIALVAPGVRVGGSVRVKDLRVKTSLDKAAEVAEASGRVSLRDISVGLAAQKVTASGINADIELARRVAPAGQKPLAAAALSARADRAFAPLRRAGWPDDASKRRRKRRPSLGKRGRGKKPAEAPPQPPGVSLRGVIRVGSAEAAGARVKGVRLALAVAAEQRGMALRAAGLRTSLRVAGVRYRAAGLGTLATPVALDVAAWAALPPPLSSSSSSSKAKSSGGSAKGGGLDGFDLSLSQLTLSVPGLLRARVGARLRPNKTFFAKLALDEISLGRLARRLPRPLTAALRRFGVRGDVGLSLEARGRVPDMTPGASMPRLLARGGGMAVGRSFLLGGTTLPVRAKVGVRLRRLAVTQRAAGGKTLRVRGAAVKLDLDARPGRVRLDGRISARQASGPGFRARGLGVPLRVSTRGRKLRLSLSPTVLSASAQALTLRGALINLRLGAPVLPLLAPKRTRSMPLTLDASITASSVREGNRLRVGRLQLAHKLRTRVPLSALVRGRALEAPRTSLSLKGSIGRLALAVPGMRASVGGAALGVGVEIDPAKAQPVALRFSLKAAVARHAQLAARVDRASLTLATSVGGVPLRFPAPPLRLDAISTGPLTLAIRAGRVKQRGAPPPAPRNVSIDVAGQLARGGELSLSSFDFKVPSHAVTVKAKARVGQLFRRRPRGELPPLDAEVTAGIDAPKVSTPRRAFALIPGLKLAGKVGLRLRARRTARRRLMLSGKLLAEHVHLWQSSSQRLPRDDGSSLHNVKVLHVADLNVKIPIRQALLFTRRGITAPHPRHNVLGASGRGRLYPALRPYAARRETLGIRSVSLTERITAYGASGKRINTRTRRFSTGKIALDLAVSDATMSLERFYIAVLGGDISGSLRAQLLAPPRFDVRAAVGAHITSVDPTKLAPGRLAPAPISALLDLRYQRAKRLLEGKIAISKLSLVQLDALLLYLDPNEVDPNIQRTRKLINAWYVKLAKPRVKLVSIWIKYGNLNLDIEMQSRIFSGLINKQLRANRIRRVPLLTLLATAGLDTLLFPSDDARSGGSKSSPRGARKRKRTRRATGGRRTKRAAKGN